VAVAAVAASLAIVALGVRSPATDAPTMGDGRNVASYGFDLSTCLVPREQIVSGGLPRDGLQALDEPTMLEPAEIVRRNADGRGKFLVAEDRVIGVAIGGDARAYPLRFLRWHEVVNDTVGGVPMVVTYNPLCDAVVVAERAIEGHELKFGVSGLLLNSNLLLYDRTDDPSDSSLWSQLQARAVAGPAASERQRLRMLPAALSSWGDWRADHPDSLVLAPVDRLRSLYKRDPYHSYFGSDLLRFPVVPLPLAGDLSLKDRVVVVTIGGTDTVFALPRLATAIGHVRGWWNAEASGVPIDIRFDAELGTATVFVVGETDAPPTMRHAFWFAWYATHPDAPEPRP
jgi:hypothetical protein